MAEIKTLKAKYFEKDMNMKPWNANESSFYYNLIKRSAFLQGNFIKIKGDVLFNLAILKKELGLVCSPAKMPERNA